MALDVRHYSRPRDMAWHKMAPRSMAVSLATRRASTLGNHLKKVHYMQEMGEKDRRPGEFLEMKRYINNTITCKASTLKKQTHKRSMYQHRVCTTEVLNI